MLLPAFPRLPPVHQLLSTAFNFAWTCSLFQHAPPACPLSAANFVKSELNRPWKGGTDGYILGGNYQPLPPDTHSKKRNKRRCCLQVNWRCRHVGGISGRGLDSNWHRGKGLLESPDSPLTGSKVKCSHKWRISGLSAHQVRRSSLLKPNSSLQENSSLLIKDDLNECCMDFFFLSILIAYQVGLLWWRRQ